MEVAMGRETMEKYVFSGSDSLRRERDDLERELMEWLALKSAGGARPVPLQYALLSVANFAGGYVPGAEKFWNEARRDNGHL
jgi:hypothetical protein